MERAAVGPVVLMETPRGAPDVLAREHGIWQGRAGLGVHAGLTRFPSTQAARSRCHFAETGRAEGSAPHYATGVVVQVVTVYGTSRMNSTKMIRNTTAHWV